MKYMDCIVDAAEFITGELIERIKEARKDCEVLGVGIFSDEVFFQKYDRRPLRSYSERAMIASYLKGVDFVFEVRNEESLSITRELMYKEIPANKKYHIGYAPGTYDLLHEGHIEHLTEAYKQCEILVVGINNDELVKSYKGKTPMMTAKCRAEIVSSLKFVNSTFIANSLERGAANEWIKAKYGHSIDVVFIGSDWVGQNLHNPEGFRIEFTYRDPIKMKQRSSSYYREELRRLKNNE